MATLTITAPLDRLEDYSAFVVREWLATGWAPSQEAGEQGAESFWTIDTDADQAGICGHCEKPITPAEDHDGLCAECDLVESEPTA